MIWREFMRLGYLRNLLRTNPALPTAHLAALLACAPAPILVDSASRAVDPSTLDARRSTLRWPRWHR